MGDRKWHAVADDLAARIRAGEWPPGAPIPSVRVLAVHYSGRGLGSETTVRRALAAWRDAGVLTVSQGSPHVVARIPSEGESPSRRRLTLHRLDGEIRALREIVAGLQRDTHRHDEDA